MTKYVCEGRANTRQSVYYTNKDCQRLDRSSVREATRNEIRHFELRLCKFCNPDADAIQPQDQSKAHYNALKEAAEE